MRPGHTLNAVYNITNVPVLENTTLLAISISTQSVEILIARSLYSKYRYTRVLIYTVFGACLVRMHAHSAGISS